MNDKIIPSLFIQERGEESVKIVLGLTKAKTKFAVRFTGGCGYMNSADSCNLYKIFLAAFTGFSGAILFGGTRMLKKINKNIVPGITEIPPLLREQNRGAVFLGVVPKTEDLNLSFDYGLIVHQEINQDYVTIVHPNQDICLIVQASVDGASPWEAEFEECISIINNLRTFAGWQSLLICYNGGETTEKEIIKTAKLNWPILLVKGSGRISDKYANDKEFLFKYPRVMVAEKNSAAIRKKLVLAGAISESSLSLVTMHSVARI